MAFSTLTGAQVASYETKGENVLAEHANSSIAFDGSGRLYVLNTQLGMYRLTPATGKQEPYGEEKARLANPLGSPVKPYDSPANIAFNAKGSILLSNHAFVTGVVDRSAFNVLDVFVGDTASPLAKPIVP